ncbi:hypothetical protein IWZ03DRAFT_107883 [Phyllosticta citriasiana]|uniref:AA1-like domain-containing protein n=1 Tax=Phyllosticta citriasiana TaxID=595635 RepID=A0ABR1KX56_9PEZI
MRFFSSILTISAALSVAAQTSQPTKTDPCTPNGCLVIDSLTIFVHLDPQSDDNFSLDYSISYGKHEEVCVVEWAYGESAGRDKYPTIDNPVTCNGGQFATFFDSFSTIKKFDLEATYTYTVKSTGQSKTVYGKATVDSNVLICDKYLNSKRCQLNRHKVSEIKLPIYQPE